MDTNQWHRHAILFRLCAAVGLVMLVMSGVYGVAGRTLIAAMWLVVGLTTIVGSWRLATFSEASASIDKPFPGGIQGIIRQRKLSAKAPAGDRQIGDAPLETWYNRAAYLIASHLIYRMVFGGILALLLFHFIIIPGASIAALLLIAGLTAGVTAVLAKVYRE